MSLQEALDYLDELSEDEDNQIDAAETVYIEPPQFDGYITGEDDDIPEDSVPIPDYVCSEQLKSGCEVVLRSGRRWNCFDEEEENNLAGIAIHSFAYTNYD